MASYLAIDVGTDRLAAGIVDEAGEVVVRDRVTTPPRDVWPALHRLVRRVVAARPDDVDEPVGAAASAARVRSTQAGTVTPLHLPVWQGFELRERVRDLTGLPTVVGTAGTGACSPSAGSGSAAGRGRRDGAPRVRRRRGRRLLQRATAPRPARQRRPDRPHRRRARRAALPVRLAAGCLTAYASSSAIEAETNRPLRRAPASIIERTGVMIGRAVASAVAVFDLRLVVLTGAVPAAFGAPLLDAARRELDQRSRLAHVRGGADRARAPCRRSS